MPILGSSASTGAAGCAWSASTCAEVTAYPAPASAVAPLARAALRLTDGLARGAASLGGRGAESGRLRRGAVAGRAPRLQRLVAVWPSFQRLHLAISDVEPGRIWFEGDVGPIVVPRKASDLARPGWSAFVTAARTDGTWRLLEVGFVYP